MKALVHNLLSFFESYFIFSRALAQVMSVRDIFLKFWTDWKLFIIKWLKAQWKGSLPEYITRMAAAWVLFENTVYSPRQSEDDS